MSRHLALTLASALVVGTLAAAPVAAQETVQEVQAEPRVTPERATPAPPPAPARAERAAASRDPASTPAVTSTRERAFAAREDSAAQARPRTGTSSGATRRAPSSGSNREGSSASAQSRPRNPTSAEAARRAPRADGNREGSSASGRAVPRSEPQATSDRRGDGQSSGRAVDRHSRPRGDQRATGYAVPRRGAPPISGRATYYWGPSPWYYSPYGFGWSLGYFYDPYWWGNVYYGPQPGYRYVSYYEPSGAVRLKVRPREAQVFVDGYYVGIVDEFDGRFQRLRLEEGPTRIEVRLEGHETLVFEVRVLPGRTINLTGALRPLPLP